MPKESTAQNLQFRSDSPVLQWKDIFAIYDDGSYAVSDYASLARQLRMQQKSAPNGLGCLVVIPPGSRRIQDDVRAEIERILSEISVKCLCWAVLEEGFRGATIRAVLTTLGVVGARRKYPTHVTGNLADALGWVLSNLEPIGQRRAELPDVLSSCQTRLEAFMAPKANAR